MFEFQSKISKAECVPNFRQETLTRTNYNRQTEDLKNEGTQNLQPDAQVLLEPSSFSSLFYSLMYTFPLPHAVLSKVTS